MQDFNLLDRVSMVGQEQPLFREELIDVVDRYHSVFLQLRELELSVDVDLKRAGLKQRRLHHRDAQESHQSKLNLVFLNPTVEVSEQRWRASAE